MTGTIFDVMYAPLGYTAGEVVVPDGLQVVAAEVDEASLRVALHYMADSGAGRMRRTIRAAPTGAKFEGAGRHVWTVLRLGVPFHYVIEE